MISNLVSKCSAYKHPGSHLILKKTWGEFSRRVQIFVILDISSECHFWSFTTGAPVLTLNFYQHQSQLLYRFVLAAVSSFNRQSTYFSIWASCSKDHQRFSNMCVSSTLKLSENSDRYWISSHYRGSKLSLLICCEFSSLKERRAHKFLKGGMCTTTLKKSSLGQRKFLPQTVKNWHFALVPMICIRIEMHEKFTDS